MRQSTPNTDTHLGRQELWQIYTGELTRDNAPELYEHLNTDCASCETLVGEEPLGEAWELSTQESEAIFAAIRQEVMPALQAKDPASTGGSWLSWLQPIRWAPIFAAAAIVLLLPLWHKPTSTPTHPVALTPHPTHKSASCGAYLEIKVLESSQNKTPRPFHPKARYTTEQAFLFAFLVTRPGYLYLLRKDEKGNLEQLFPFSPKGNKLYETGRVLLTHQKQPQAYYLEKELIGLQTLWLVHADKPQRFPKQMQALSKQQKALLSRADHVTFSVASSK